MALEIDEGQTIDDYTRDSVKMVVEEDEESLVITYADLSVEDIYHLVIELVSRMAKITRQGYNDTLDDLKEIEGDQ